MVANVKEHLNQETDMKIEIYGGEKQPEEPILRLRLTRDNGQIYLVSMDERGVQDLGGVLLSITEDGILMSRGVSPHLGLPLDGDGRVKTVPIP